MIVYGCIIVLMLLGNVILRKKQYLIFMSIILILFAGLRHTSMGVGDVEKIYLPLYTQSKVLSFGEIFSNHSIKSGIGYIYLMKLFTTLGLPYQFFLAINSAFFILAAERIVYKYSKDYLLSQVILIASAYFFSFALIRQYFAVSILLLAYPYLFERKALKYLILILFGALFHYTILIAILLYPLARYCRSDKFLVIIILFGIIFGLIFQSLVLKLIELIYPQLYYYYVHGVYKTGNGIAPVWLIILLIPLIFYYIIPQKSIKKLTFSKSSQLAIEGDLLLIMAVGILCYCFSAVVGEFYRVSQYCTVLYIILLPNILKFVNNKTIGVVIRWSAIILFLIYMFLSTLQNLNCLNYLFFLQ